ncbi:MAG: hypothetical protein IAE96_06040 [Chitinophagaceae bacterium]|nr:hypothetical protein [Chitinophagaceae bacterium]
MKHILFAFLTLSFFTAAGQTADEIVQQHANAMGGLDAFNKVSTYKMTGSASAQGMDLPVTTVIINGKSMRTDVEVMGQSITNVYHNGTGWKINPFAGATEATEVTGTELIDFKAQTSLASNLMDYKQRGHKVELLEPVTEEGIKMFRLKLTAKEDGRVTTYFINSTDFLVKKSVTLREIQGQEMEITTFYSDYKEFGGLKFAGIRRQEVMGQVMQELHLEKVELNLTIDESVFNK